MCETVKTIHPDKTAGRQILRRTDTKSWSLGNDPPQGNKADLYDTEQSNSGALSKTNTRTEHTGPTTVPNQSPTQFITR